MFKKIQESVGKSYFTKITKEYISEIWYLVNHSLWYGCTIIQIATPYLTLILGAALYKSRGKFAIGGEILLPIGIYLVTGYLKKYANMVGLGEDAPVPVERFTEVDESEVIYVKNDRLQELVQFIYDYEEWLVRKGLL